MTSTSIYSPSISVLQSTQLCFVYKWSQISTGKWYIGSHTSKSAHPEDGYICSSKIVKPMIKDYPEDWIRIILETGTRNNILLLEHELLKCLNAAQSEYSYNKTNGAGTFSNSGKIASESTKKKMSTTRIGRTHSIETRTKMSTLATGRKLSVDHCNKISISQTGKSLSPEHRAKIRTSSLGKTHTIETREKLSIVNTGKTLSIEHRAKMSIAMRGNIITCPHCSLSGGISNMKRWHFDNCKFRIQSSDFQQQTL